MLTLSIYLSVYLKHAIKQAFGGAYSDKIYGGEGNDVILGDFGLYDAREEFLPNQYYESIIYYHEYAGPDEIYGEDGDDVLMGQEVSRKCCNGL